MGLDVDFKGDTDEYDCGVSSNNNYAHLPTAKMCGPRNRGEWPTLVLTAKKKEHFGAEAFYKVREIDVSVGGTTMTTLMDALLENPQTLAYLARSVDVLRKNNTLRGGNKIEIPAAGE